ncbi:MAG: TniQ family protein [Stigonema ocellatum SAG 48.90 = DSM 106950]|nr:TniQ family protein [Stigonema ocellatum SAG 48.90 = DSM 106950]
MLSPILKLYSEYDLQKPTIPPRSRLYCLEPIGVGSEYVESLTGYVARLAQQHCVTPRQLLLTEIAPHLARLKNRLNYQPETVSKVFGIDMCKPAANGTGLTAAYLVEALSALTKRNDLHKLSLLNWALLPKRGLLRHQRAWCPSCYLEWQQGGKTIYEPLLWLINIVVICPYHHNRLLCQCPHCHQHLPVFYWNFRPGYCSNCNQWLVNYEYKTKHTNIEADLDWQLNVVRNVGELLAFESDLNSPPKINNISDVISTYINQVFKSNKAAFSRSIGIRETTIGFWCNRKVIPPLDKLLLLANYFGISLLDFLSKDNLVFNHSHQPEIINVKQSKKPYKRISLERKSVLNIVLTEVTLEDPPPSLEDVALRLKYRPHVLQHHFPELCQVIKVRHADFKKLSQKQKIQPILEAALQEFPPPSLSSIARRLGYKNNSYLYRCFPELSRAVSKRYQEHLNVIGIEARERIRQEIETIALTLHEKGYKPTQALVTRLLSKPKIMLNWYARKVLREILHTLGYE